MILRITYIAAAIATCASAHAAPASSRMPIDFVGDWCFVSRDGYDTRYQLPSWIENGKCEKVISINPYGWWTADDKVNCEPTKITLRSDTAPSGTSYITLVTARCRADGAAGPGKRKTFELTRYKGNLTVNAR